MTYNLKNALLNITNHKVYSLSVVATLSIVLAALITVLTLAYIMLLKPLPYPEQMRLVKAEYAQIDQTGALNTRAFNYPALIDLYKNHNLFEQAALVYYGEQRLDDVAGLPIVNTSFVTPQWFEMFAIKLHLGRGFTQTEALDSFNPVAVISYRTWQNDFASKENIIGQTLSVGAQQFKIIGVAAANFKSPALIKTGQVTDVWLPWDYNLTSAEAKPFWWNRYSRSHFVAKLPSDVSIEQASKRLSQYVDDVWQQHITTEAFFAGWHIELELNTLQTVILKETPQNIYWLILAVTGLVIIACVNISNVFIVRTAARKHSLALSAALGATRFTLFKQFWLEIALLIGLASIVGLALAAIFLATLSDFAMAILPRANELSINGVSFLITLVSGLILTTLFAFLCTRIVNYQQLISSLKSAGKGTTVQVGKRVWQGLVAFQVAVACTLLFINFLVFSVNKSNIDEAFTLPLEQLTSLKINVASHIAADRGKANQLLEQVANELALLPEVRQVSRSSSPINDNLITWSLVEVASNQNVLPYGKSVDELYFSLLKQPVLQGRGFTNEDTKSNANVIIINDVLAEKLSNDGNALGMHLSFDITSGRENDLVIIGIVKAMPIPGKTSLEPKAYLARAGYNSFIIEFKNAQHLTKNTLNTLLQSIDSGLSVHQLAPLNAQRDTALFRQYVVSSTTLMIIAATIALTSIGLIGIMRYSVLLRRAEIGIHLCVGAKPLALFLLVFKQNGSAIVTGILLSIALLLALQQPLQLIADGVPQIMQLGMLFMTLLFVISLGALACYLPLSAQLKRPAIYGVQGSQQ
ncbi:ABC transporter permease [Pseudoalteromonas rhizosphaerae]|uniref:ABC transporter permease n=1 Tax=Pseudoalteromonas rhizosphaerae TaxID=2518973 RepID=UPI00384C4969